MDWLSNPWFVGVGAGILGGLIVTLVSRAVFSRRDRGEYAQKVLAANREVIYALRPGISEGHIPEEAVVNSLISATARKYALGPGDLYSCRQVGEELTKEIMDSSFISASTKQTYCDALKPLRDVVAPPIPGVVRDLEARRPELQRYRSRLVTMMSGLLGAMTAVMTLAFVLFSRDGLNLGPTSESLAFLVPLVVAIATTLLAGMTTFFRTELRRMAAARRRSEPSGADEGQGDDRDPAT